MGRKPYENYFNDIELDDNEFDDYSDEFKAERATRMLEAEEFEEEHKVMCSVSLRNA